ncbi:hypothetical protein Tco_0848993 [Tanacetum coccineum]
MSSSTSPEATPQSPKQAPPSPDYVHGPEYPEYLATPNDKIPVEDQPLPADASPIALSPDYEVEEEESSEDDDEEEEEASKEDDEVEEDHLASADSILPAIDSVPSAKKTELFETNESAATPPPPRSSRIIVPLSSTSLCRAQKTVKPHPPMAASTKVLIVESDILEVDMPSQKRLCLTAPTHRFEVGESSTDRQTRHTLARRVDYRFIDTLDASIRASKGRVMTAVEEAWSCSEDRSMALEALIRTQEARITALEAQITTLQTQHSRMEW